MWKNIGGKNTLEANALERERVETLGGGGYGAYQYNVK
jgi:N-methylhydantoinase B/oxoprolinase/acetone carboxylase alpha subunit